MSLPAHYYSAQQVKAGEVLAARSAGVPMYTLMKRAGLAAFQLLRQSHTRAQHLLIYTGGGNNGGDGYIVATLALQAGLSVTLCHHGDPERLSGDAALARDEFCQAGGKIRPDDTQFYSPDVVVDAVLGTGLSGQVRSSTRQLIQMINSYECPVIAIDVPSGLCANTGTVLGAAVRATQTISFIGLKQGLVTGQARDYVGQMHFAGLEMAEVFDCQNSPSVYAITPAYCDELLQPRRQSAHKGRFGRSVLIGGDLGMGGAILLASEACLRAGSGLTATLTQQQHLTPLLVRMPEVMASDWLEGCTMRDRIHWASAIGFGPGLGQTNFSKTLFDHISHQNKPKVFDADALNLLAMYPNQDDNRIITPHPGEAARLLDCTVADIEADRYQATKSLQEKYGGVCVLKGAGTIVSSDYTTRVCLVGNPGMATGGMGDVLTGVITGFLAQGYELMDAASLGVYVHSRAADLAAGSAGERGLVASDLFPCIREVVNRVR